MERRIERLQLDNEWRMVSVLDIVSYCVFSVVGHCLGLVALASSH